MESKEIDLIKVFSDFYSFLKEKLLYIVVIELIAVLFALYYYNSSKEEKIYSKTFSLTSEYVSDYLLVEMLNSIDFSNTRTLSNQIMVSEESAKAVIAISPETRIYSDEQTSVFCKILFSDYKKGKVIEEALINFVKNKEFVKNKYLVEKRYHENLISILEKKIKDFNFNKSIVEVDDVLIDSPDLVYFNLLKQKENLIKELNSFQAVDVVNSTSIKIEKQSHSIYLIIVLSMFLGFISSIIMIFFINLFCKIKERG